MNMSLEYLPRIKYVDVPLVPTRTICRRFRSEQQPREIACESKAPPFWGCCQATNQAPIQPSKWTPATENLWLAKPSAVTAHLGVLHKAEQTQLTQLD
ncbi:hypothetical protein VTI74DRAFT_10036 [Chaetomium olivicolor]